jgi:chromodomain-helicase-DNA-binding protein 1
MSSPRETSPANGHDSSVDNDDYVDVSNDMQSESDLSEVQPPDMEASSSSASPIHTNPPNGSALPKIQLSPNPASDPSEHDASEDADFDMVDSPRSALPDVASLQPAAMKDGRPPPRRKLGQPLEDDFIRDNPELYGLRRSVRLIPVTSAVLILTCWLQSRPVQRRHIVSCCR